MARDLNPPPPPPDDPFDGLRKLPEVCETLAAWLDYMNLVADFSMQTINELARTKPGVFPELQHWNAGARKPKAKGPPWARFARSATLTWGPVSARLVVDGQTVHLSPTLGILAELLLDDASFPSAQSGSGWKLRKDLRLRMAKRTGRQISKHALENLLSRLKRTLRTRAGLDWLVETGGPLAVRFAMQKYIPGTNPAPGSGNKPVAGPDHRDPDYGAYLGEI